MSPRWNRSVRLHIGVDAVGAVAQAGWPRAVAIAATRRSVATGASAADRAPHAQAIEAALGELGALAPIQGARLEVEMASALLHLDVVEGDFGAQTDRQLQGVAAACVAEMLGDDAARRGVRWHLQRDDRHLLLVALAEDWIESLQAAATSAQLRLARVAPAFLARWNECGDAMRPGHGVFAVDGATELALAAVVDGSIAAISVGAGVGLQVEAPAPTAPAPRPLHPSPIVSSGFSPDPQGTANLDERVDRFLSSRGQDPDLQSAFVLVASDSSPPVAASTRWCVIPSPEGRP